MNLYSGVVENRQDPLKLGRCQVRIVGLHTHDKSILPTADLPWAYPLQPVTSAAMSGIGQAPVGPVEGTWVMIVFRDEDEQYPIMIGTVGGIPQSPSAVDSEITGIIFKEGEETTTNETSNVVTTNQNSAVQTTLTPQQQAQNVLQPGLNPTTSSTTTVSTDITTEPPPEFKSLRDQRKKSIQALLAACDKFGIKSREVKCSILAMAGGESGFIPEDEHYSYSAAGLKSTFYTTFVKKHPDKVTDYERAPKKGISREQFFDFVYAPENNGSQLGNTQPGDGGKYYGRGLTGITGRANYKKYGDLIGVDLLSNPNLLNSDLNISAQASAMMIWDNTKKKFPKVPETANPEYFYAAKKAQGNDTGDGAEKRLRYYEYFYGNKVSSTFTEEKTAAPPPPPATSPAPAQPSPSPSASGPIGFKDPDDKYPLKKFFHEPDTNRLARGVKIGTVHTIKDGLRAKNVPIALADETFSEPTSTFAAKYPYNHVMETESGHVQEFDDTPGHERIMTYHRKGTYTEVDPNGTETRHIVGDSYHIMDRNGSIYIAGDCNLTVEGKINILSKAVVNIEVYNDANIKVGNDASIGVANNVELAVGNNMDVEVAKNLNIHANSINIQAETSFNIKAATLNETADTMNVNASDYKETVGESSYRWEGDKYVFTGGNTYERHDSGIDYSCPSDPSRTGDSDCSDVSSATQAPIVVTNLVAPPQGVNVYKHMNFLESPPSEGESVFLIETEEEWASPAGIAKQEELVKQNGPAPSDIQDSTTPVGGLPVSLNASCTIISGTENFTNDFRLSPNFTLGMLIDGGVNGPNKLRDQNGLTKQQIVCNLAQLCINIYEPMLAVLPGGIAGYGKQWKINSGYRISSNIPAGGVAKSDHMLGRATDFTLLPYDNTKAQRNFEFTSVIEKILPYDQIIMEYMSGGSNWIHIGYRGTKEGDTAGGGINRKMAFTMSNGKTVKKDGKTGFFLLQ